MALTSVVMAAARSATRRPGLEPALRARLVQLWAARLARAMGLRVCLRGGPPPLPALIVANHRSYADIPALLSAAPCTFLAKAEVASWPLIGPLAAALGTVFVDRDCPESRRRARARLAGMLEAGHSVAVFPEGTTHRGPDLLPFRPGMFQEAARIGVSVVPVAIGYPSPEDSWVGDDTLLRHFTERFSASRVPVEVSFGAPCISDRADVLIEHAMHWIRCELRAQTLRRGVQTHLEGGGDDRESLSYRSPLPAGKIPS